MPLHVLGLSHHTAPLDVRERIAFPAERLLEALAAIKAREGVEEAVLVSTCNRTEIYVDAPDVAAVRAWLVEAALAAGAAVEAMLYAHAGDEAVRHAFRVASGLDSMVLGEPQILGQVKEAVRNAENAGTLGSNLHKLFQQTFAVAKRVRTETSVGAQSISMASAALKLAQNVYGDLSQTKVLLIGVGEMVELAATYFAAQRPRALAVANRTLERGEAFAQRFDGEAMGLADVPARLHEFDIVITGTASTLPILGKGLIERALKARRNRPMFIVDFAVPRDVEAEAAELGDLFLYSIDDLGKIVQDGSVQRQAAATEAEAIVATQVEAFRQWQGSRAAVPVIVRLRGKADQYRNAELAKAKARLARGEDAHAVLEALALGLANKFIHHPTQALNRAADEDRAQLQRAIDTLFPDGDSDEGSTR
ncbi:glutamyl-tRNA reductase [Usitatibacter palustris]|uniref:Glutamyl-tRNA reductase n=1 Tax=Usitatibacter palustris TaxID=2732487 RepID=A0A6M4H3F5_9PROT|nr:glutamyl-tRNA reductase [Usitatibacter palustris]QJR13608.1 Glutamyl-tRNA reductase [Usitatibacter palustris]